MKKQGACPLSWPGLANWRLCPAENKRWQRGWRGPFHAGHSPDTPRHVPASARATAWVPQTRSISISLASRSPRSWGQKCLRGHFPVAPGLSQPRCLVSKSTFVWGGGGAAIRAPLLMKRAALWPGKLPVRAGLRRARGKPEKCHFVGSTKLERAGSAATKWLPPPQPLRTPSDSSCLRLGGPSSPIRQHLPRCPLHSRRE